MENKLKELENRIEALENKVFDKKPDPPQVETIVVNETGPIQVEKPAPIEQKAIIPLHPISETVESLRILLESNEWAPAVDPGLICNVSSEQDKEERAEGIIDLIIDTKLENTSFLDFGCGEGHVTKRTTTQKPKVTVGYDINKSDRWQDWKDFPCTLTSNWAEVIAKGPYNIILLYDVVDHMMPDPVAGLKQMQSIAAPGAKIYVRCHPFSSRHGTHIYHQKNKAFIHLVFTPDELKSLGLEGQNIFPVLHPVLTYESWFKQAGLTVTKPVHITKEPVERFFIDTPLIANRIKANWRSSHEPDLKSGKIFPVHQLEQQFHDYILTR